MSKENIISNNEEQTFSFPKKENAFALPASYFDLLEEKVMNKILLEEEIQNYITLSNINKIVCFSLPSNYFLENENEILLKTEKIEHLALSSIHKTNNFQLPSNYFESFEQKLSTPIVQSEEINDLKTLNEIEKKKVFQVQENYFDTFSEKIIQQIKTIEIKGKGKVIDFGFTTFFTLKRVVSIAAVFLFGCFSLWYFIYKPTVKPDGDCKTLACLEKRELLNEETLGNLDEENLYELVDIGNLSKVINKEQIEKKK